MLILPSEKKWRAIVPLDRWQQSSQSHGIEQFWVLTGRLNDGAIAWRGVFRDREDADAFLWAIATGSIAYERELWRLPDPWWHPDLGELPLVYDFASPIVITSGTIWSVPGDWNNSSNTEECIAGGGGGAGANASFGATAGGGGGYSKAINQVYTPNGSITVQVGVGGPGGGTAADGTAGTQSFLKNNANSANVILSNGGTAGHNDRSGGQGGSIAGATGSTLFAGGNGGQSDGLQTGGYGGGGAGGTTATGSNGNNASGTTGGIGGAGGATGGGAGGAANGGTGSPGTGFSNGTHGAGGGGGGGNDGGTVKGGDGGLYGAGGGGAALDAGSGGAGGSGKNGIVYITYVVVVSYGWLRGAFEPPATIKVAVPYH